jgi:methylmalonyl-CoA mutase N-terminal domain/subunit
MIARGMAIDSFAPRFSFFFGAYTNLLEEVAKLRAVRRVWAEIMKERFGAKDPRSMTLRCHIQTDGFTLTEQQPLNNIVRVTLQALGAVLGGCQSLHTNSFDEALALPTEAAVQVALRTQQILAYESGAADTVDPLGGSYYIEWLTDKIEKGINDYIKKIDELGGAVKAIKQGYVQREIARSSYDYQRAVDSGEQAVVGVNKFNAKDEHPVNLFVFDESVEKKQIRRLKKLKQTRDNGKVESALKEVKRVAGTGANVMPALIEAVKTYATVGEITDVFREVFGEYREPSVL